MDVPQFIHSPMEGHLSSFQFLTIMNKAALNIYVQVFCERTFSNQVGKYPRARFLDCMERLCLALQETAKLSSKVTVSLCIPTSNE